MVTADTIRAAISNRTGAIIVTHLFGNAVEMDEIFALARDHGLSVIEDCAQALGTQDRGVYVGLRGDLACFSMQQTKLLSTGEGGFVASNDDALAARAHQFMNKSRNYDDPWPDHHFLSMNFRMTEMQAAVALPQVDVLDRTLASRRKAAAALNARLHNLPGLTPVAPRADVSHSYWRYAFHVDAQTLGVDNQALGAALRIRGIPNAPRYQSAAMDWTVMRERKTFGTSSYPFTLARPEAIDYQADHWPGLVQGQNSLIVLPWTNRHEPAHAQAIGDAIASELKNVKAKGL